MDLAQLSCAWDKAQLEFLPLLALNTKPYFSSPSISSSCPYLGGYGLSSYREQFSIPLLGLNPQNPGSFWAQHDHISKSHLDKCLTFSSMKINQGLNVQFLSALRTFMFSLNEATYPNSVPPRPLEAPILSLF